LARTRLYGKLRIKVTALLLMIIKAQAAYYFTKQTKKTQEHEKIKVTWSRVLIKKLLRIFCPPAHVQ
jgi:hypothetical protein